MTIVFLALLTLIEGVRRVPRGSVVLHRVLFGQWTVEQPEPGGRLRLLSWWSPFMSTIVLAPRPKYQRTDAAAVRAQLEGRELYTALFDLRVLGVLELIVLVLGLPLALQRFGALGFLAALGAANRGARRCAGRSRICHRSRHRAAPRRCSRRRCATFRPRSPVVRCFPGTRFCGGFDPLSTMPATDERSTVAFSKDLT